MYAQVTVVVDGALEAEETFHDYALMDEYIKGVEQDALGDGCPTEVYILEHEHADDVEDCACAQFVTDHHPAYSWNTED